MKREYWRNFDFWLFGAVIFLGVFGIVMFRSAIAGNEVLAELIPRQVLFFVIGIFVMVGVSMIDYHYWAPLSRIMYIVMVLFLIVIFVLGQESFGAQRWLDIGFAVIQPSELAKIVVILVMANYFQNSQREPHDLLWVARSGLLIAGITVWVLLQPDLSTSIVLFVIWFALLWLAGLPIQYLFVLGLAGLVAGTLAFPFLEEYQQARVVNFFFPDPNARHGNAYNVEQALVTIGSGGLFGQGYGHSSQVQLRFLKVRHTDFIFSALAAEFGFIGAVIVIFILVFVVLRCVRAARVANDLYGSLISFGYATLIFFQTAVNIGVNLNVIPVTGLTLPFISYGGSSLLSLCFGIGLVESVVSRTKTLDH